MTFSHARHSFSFWIVLFVSLFYSHSSFAANAANELTLHFIPSPAGINWSSPHALADSVLINQVAEVESGKRHSIGHVYEEINCKGQHFFTGTTDSGNTQEARALFREGYGLGIVLKAYVGFLDDSAQAEADLAKMHVTGRSNFIRFLISDSTCDRVLEYVKEYHDRGYDLTYGGLNARPRKGQGSGCSAFGASFLEIAGLDTPEFEESFTRSLIMPRKFVGGDITRSRVSILKILLALHAKWDSDLSKDGIPVHFYDPERMFDWTSGAVLSLETNNARTFPWPAQVSYIVQSQGVTFDATNVATPAEPLFEVPPPAL